MQSEILFLVTVLLSKILPISDAMRGHKRVIDAGKRAIFQVDWCKTVSGILISSKTRKNTGGSNLMAKLSVNRAISYRILNLRKAVK